MAPKIISSLDGKLGAYCVTVIAAFVVLVAAGCATTAPVPKAAVPAPKKPTTTVLAAPPTPRLSHSTPGQGANPAVWMSTFCGGFNDENAAASALGQSPQSLPSAQDLRNELLQFLDTAQQGSATTAGKLTQLGPPRVTGGKQVQDIAVGYFTTTAKTFGDHRAKLATLDANDPDFAQKASQLMPGPADFSSVTNTQLEQVTNNQELLPAFLAAPECQRLITSPTHP